MDRTAAGIVLIAAGVAWIVWYRRLSGAQRDALTRQFSASGIAPSGSTGTSGPSGTSGGIIPGPSPTPWRGMPDPAKMRPPVGPGGAIDASANAARDAWNKVRSDFLHLWHSTFPNVPVPGGESKPLPRLPTPPIAPSRGGY